MSGGKMLLLCIIFWFCIVVLKEFYTESNKKDHFYNPEYRLERE